MGDLVTNESSFEISSGRVTGFERWLLRRMFATLGNPPLGLVLWNGEELRFGDARPTAWIRIADRRALYSLLVYPELNFGERYMEGRIAVDGDLVTLLETVFLATAAARPGGSFGRLLNRVRHRRSANSLSGSRANIHHHYDIGNRFYALWLDAEAMQYTCAYYPRPEMTLEQAQLAKMHHVCRKVRLRAGETVVEAGCGWGGLALLMAREYGAVVRAYNISREQIAYARERAARDGLGDRVEFIEGDYREIEGEYDVFMSVGMLEHVGPEHYHELGGVIHRCLKNGGRGLIHSIGRNREMPLNPWIEKRIFPGAHPPTLRRMMRVFEPWGFSVLDVENLRLHYSKTLSHWLERFEHNADPVRSMFDERFVRAWRLYLSGSIAAFNTGVLQLFQVAFARSRHNDLPWSRAHLYDSE